MKDRKRELFVRGGLGPLLAHRLLYDCGQSSHYVVLEHRTHRPELVGALRSLLQKMRAKGGSHRSLNAREKQAQAHSEGSCCREKRIQRSLHVGKGGQGTACFIVIFPPTALALSLARMPLNDLLRKRQAHPPSPIYSAVITPRFCVTLAAPSVAGGTASHRRKAEPGATPQTH